MLTHSLSKQEDRLLFYIIEDVHDRLDSRTIYTLGFPYKDVENKRKWKMKLKKMKKRKGYKKWKLYSSRKQNPNLRTAGISKKWLKGKEQI